jgi:hypothetical protein
MREEPQMVTRTGSEKSRLREVSDLDRKYWVALGMYAVLGLLVWFTMDAGKFLVMGKPVELRLLPLIVIGGLALRTVLAHQAEKIRRSGEKNGS